MKHSLCMLSGRLNWSIWYADNCLHQKTKFLEELEPLVNIKLTTALKLITWNFQDFSNLFYSSSLNSVLTITKVKKPHFWTAFETSLITH